jgi:hypothetical protein
LGPALNVASAHQLRPDEIGGHLVAGEHGVTTAHVLIEAQLAARPQDPAEFSERRLDVTHRAQEPGDHDRIELAVGGWQFPGRAVDHPNRNRGRRHGLAGAVTEVWLRLDGHHFPYGPGVVREVQAVARTDLDHPASQPIEQLAPELTVAPVLTAGRKPVKVTREQRVLYQCHTFLPTTRAPTRSNRKTTSPAL